MRFKKNLLIGYCLLLGIATQAQDSLVLKNGNVIVGEMKEEKKSLLLMSVEQKQKQLLKKWFISKD